MQTRQPDPSKTPGSNSSAYLWQQSGIGTAPEIPDRMAQGQAWRKLNSQGELTVSPTGLDGSFNDDPSWEAGDDVGDLHLVVDDPEMGKYTLQDLVGTKDGVNQAFTAPSNFADTSAVWVIWEGKALAPVTDFTATLPNVITLLGANLPESGDTLKAGYFLES